jgi:hypothetical protein
VYSTFYLECIFYVWHKRLRTGCVFVWLFSVTYLLFSSFFFIFSFIFLKILSFLETFLVLSRLFFIFFFSFCDSSLYTHPKLMLLPRLENYFYLTPKRVKYLFFCSIPLFFLLSFHPIPIIYNYIACVIYDFCLVGWKMVNAAFVNFFCWFFMC